MRVDFSRALSESLEQYTLPLKPILTITKEGEMTFLKIIPLLALGIKLPEIIRAFGQLSRFHAITLAILMVIGLCCWLLIEYIRIKYGK